MYKDGFIDMEEKTLIVPENEAESTEEPGIIEEIVIEELSIDGVCGVY
jgi:mycofactocin precursor